MDTKNFVIILTALIFSVGCFYIKSDYKYISLEQLDGIQIISHGKSELSGLKSDNEMPVRYELARKNYVLIFELDKKNYWPSIFVSAKSLSNVGLIIEAGSFGSCGGFEDWGFQYMIDNLPALRYVWSPAFNINCRVRDNEDYPIEQIISFAVKNKEGKILGEEKLPFTLKRNGTYYDIDAI